MTGKILRSILPLPPYDYNRKYAIELVRALERTIDELRNPNVNFQGLPDVAAANSLVVGDVFVDGGFLKIKGANDIFSGSFEATASLGTVTVTTP